MNAITRLLCLSLALWCVDTSAQPSVDCGYSQAPPTWVQWTGCTTVAVGVTMATDRVIEGLDTTTVRTVTNTVSAKYMWIQAQHVPANRSCVTITLQKRVRCK